MGFNSGFKGLIIDGVAVVTECKGQRIGAENSETALSTCRIANLL